MIICVCNALNDAACSAAACRPECATVGCVYRHLGARVRCGKCVPMMADLFRRVRAADTCGDAAEADERPSVAAAAAAAG